jgi:hypothetical protein
MNRFFQIISIFVLLISTAMQCENGTFKAVRDLRLSVTPNPIPVNNGKAKLICEMSILGNKRFKRIDSLVFEFITRLNDIDTLLGASSLQIADTWNYQPPLKISKKFELDKFDIIENAVLSIQMKMYVDGKFKTSERFPIGKFAIGQNER